MTEQEKANRKALHDYCQVLLEAIDTGPLAAATTDWMMAHQGLPNDVVNRAAKIVCSGASILNNVPRAFDRVLRIAGHKKTDPIHVIQAARAARHVYFWGRSE